jgi:hypothetical protein
MIPPILPVFDELIEKSEPLTFNSSANSSSSGSWLPVTTMLLVSSLIGRSKRTFTDAPLSKPSASCGISMIPSAFMNEVTTPLPRLSGVAIICPSTQPIRARMNSRYSGAETIGLDNIALAYLYCFFVLPLSRWIIGRSTSSITTIPDTGYPGIPRIGLA